MYHHKANQDNSEQVRWASAVYQYYDLLDRSLCTTEFYTGVIQQKENVNPNKPSGSTDQPATQEVCNKKETCLNTVVAYSITKLNFDRNIIYRCTT